MRLRPGERRLAFGGNFWAGAATGATANLLRNIPEYAASTDQRMADAKAEYGLQVDHQSSFGIFFGSGHLDYHMIDKSEYDAIHEEYGSDETGSDLLDEINTNGAEIDSKIVQSSFRVGNFHFRYSADGSTPDNIPPGYSYHYDNFDPNFSLGFHLFFDTWGESLKHYN